MCIAICYFYKRKYKFMHSKRSKRIHTLKCLIIHLGNKGDFHFLYTSVFNFCEYFLQFLKTTDKEKNHCHLKLDEGRIIMALYMQKSKCSQERGFVPPKQTLPRDSEWVWCEWWMESQVVWLGTSKVGRRRISKEAQLWRRPGAHVENMNWPIFPFVGNTGLYRRMVGNKTGILVPSIPSQVLWVLGGHAGLHQLEWLRQEAGNLERPS